MSVRRAQREIDSQEFAEWCAWRRIRHDPDDIRTARICWTIARVGGNDKATIEDFLPKRVRPMTGREIKLRFSAFAKAHEAREQAREDRRRRRAARGNKDSRRSSG